MICTILLLASMTVSPFDAGRTVVSDTNRFTCGSGSVSCVSPDGSRIFAPYVKWGAVQGKDQILHAVLGF